MNLCLHKTTAADHSACTHPLPCPVHGTRREPVTLIVEDYEWLIERSARGLEQLTLFGPGGQWIATREVIAADHVDYVRQSMLRDAQVVCAGDRVRIQ